MSEHVMRKSGVHGYEGAWLSRWTQSGGRFELQAHHSNRNAKCSTIINLQEDGHQLSKGSTSSMKLKGKILSGCLDLSPNPDLNKRPLIVGDRGNSIDGEEGETSSSATKSMDAKDFLSDNTNMFKEGKRIRLDPETTDSRSNVKRLKSNALDDYTGNETKSMIVVKGPSGEKVSYFFHRILKCEINKPFRPQIKSLNMGRGEEEKENVMLHPWIQRWSGKKAAETHVQGGDRKGTVLEKQFPSVAAMALMGKALRRFKPEWS
ncbi:unnamed protein product [Microthlaspi erraticum]|uniref:Uncharacterized protein n=1 Tax=Microthlaspi erraticum TaxID=1685480 RepID=A0A6D2HUH2_9BRAS|nr:unnamed protein product [Microthlaspi erraticum]